MLPEKLKDTLRTLRKSFFVRQSSINKPQSFDAPSCLDVIITLSHPTREYIRLGYNVNKPEMISVITSNRHIHSTINLYSFYSSRSVIASNRHIHSTDYVFDLPISRFCDVIKNAKSYAEIFDALFFHTLNKDDQIKKYRYYNFFALQFSHDFQKYVTEHSNQIQSKEELFNSAKSFAFNRFKKLYEKYKNEYPYEPNLKGVLE